LGLTTVLAASEIWITVAEASAILRTELRWARLGVQYSGPENCIVVGEIELNGRLIWRKKGAVPRFSIGQIAHAGLSLL
jgi:hypothetical protein